MLTDGTLLLHADGSESKVFDIKDGTGIVWAQRLGLTVGFLSARSSAATTQRAAQLGITLVHQGVGSKLETYEQIADSLMLDEDDSRLHGRRHPGSAGARPRRAWPRRRPTRSEDVRSRVHWVARAKGGAGAARELIELILRAQGRWDPLLATYLTAPEGQQR